MAGILPFLVLIFSFSFPISQAAIFHPILDDHRSAALELFKPVDGSFGSLEETYEALRTFQVLGIEKVADVSQATCPLISETLKSPYSDANILFNALRVNHILNCAIDADIYESVAAKLQATVKDANSLLEFYHSVGGLVLRKDEHSQTVALGDADATFHSIKALSQRDGRWRYSFSGSETSSYATGLALETLAGVISLSSSDIEKSMIGTVKNDVMKLFDSLEKYDDGSFYFDEKLVEAPEHQGPLSTTSSVVRGIMMLAAVAPGKLIQPAIGIRIDRTREQV